METKAKRGLQVTVRMEVEERPAGFAIVLLTAMIVMFLLMFFRPLVRWEYLYTDSAHKMLVLSMIEEFFLVVVMLVAILAEQMVVVLDVMFFKTSRRVEDLAMHWTIMMLLVAMRLQLLPRGEMFVTTLTVKVIGALHVMFLQT